VLERLGAILTHFTAPGGDDAEHEAVIELLLLVMYADRQIRIAETDEIAAFTERHHWESPTFSFGQVLGPATAKVRRALDSVLTTNELIADIDRRIIHAPLRAETIEACRAVAQADGDITPDEQRLLDKITARLTK
jgi:uncharacterized tellurite resistance protein B-like protein